MVFRNKIDKGNTIMSFESENINPLDWQIKYKNNLWYKLLFSHLNLSPDFLNQKRGGEIPNHTYIVNRLIEASRLMVLDSGEVFSFNQMLHIASSVVLLESARQHLDETLVFIRQNNAFANIDPATIITSVALYYLIQYTMRAELLDEKDKKLLGRAYARLYQMNWMIGKEAMNELGFLSRGTID